MCQYARSARSDDPGISKTHSRPMTLPVGEQSDMKLVMMWNRLGIPCLYDACVYRAKNSDEATKARAFPVESKLNKGWWVLFYCCFGDCGMLAYKIAVCEVGIIWRKPIRACKIQCQSMAHWAPMVLSRYKTRLCHGPWRDSVCVHENRYICVVPCGMWNIHWRWSH